MPSSFESSPYLLSIWHRINKLAFGGSLPPVADIGWQVLDEDQESLDVYGGYAVRINVIGITNELKRSEEVEGQIGKMKALPRSDRPSFESIPQEDLDLIFAVAGLVGHEMAHQAASYFAAKPASHGEEFVRQATKIVEAIGGLPEVNLTNAAYWPNVLSVIRRERIRNSKTGA